jgi:hypothetical protein
VVSVDWSWWTYFLIDGHCVTCGRIISYDLATRSLTYLRFKGNDVRENPHPLGTPEYSSWLYDTVTGTYDEIWVDPARAIVLSRDDYDLIQAGRRPRSFEVLDGMDPREYFAGEKQVIASYLPASWDEA